MVSGMREVPHFEDLSHDLETSDDSLDVFFIQCGNPLCHPDA